MVTCFGMSVAYLHVRLRETTGNYVRAFEQRNLFKLLSLEAINAPSFEYGYTLICLLKTLSNRYFETS